MDKCWGTHTVVTGLMQGADSSIYDISHFCSIYSNEDALSKGLGYKTCANLIVSSVEVNGWKEDRREGRSLIQRINDNGSRILPCGMPVKMGNHLKSDNQSKHFDICQFNKH